MYELVVEQVETLTPRNKVLQFCVIFRFRKREIENTPIVVVHDDVLMVMFDATASEVQETSICRVCNSLFFPRRHGHWWY